jgi:Fe-S cluster assembly protein SufD
MMAESGFISALLDGPAAGASGAAWLDRLRADALERANRVPLPTTHEEEWRFTDLAPLTRLSFQPAAEVPAPAAAAVRERFLPEAHARLVFVDGVPSSALSHRPHGAGLRILDLREALADCPAVLETHLGKRVPPDAGVFAALNTAFLRHGAVVVVDAEHAAPGPVQVLHIATRHERPQAVYPRTLLVAGRGSRCTLVEDFVALGEATYFSAPVTEVSVASGASVTHLRLQREAAEAFQLGHCGVEQAAASRYEMVNVALGARLSRLDLRVLHAGPGCETQIDGLALIGQRQLADTHSSVDHAQPQGRLRQVYKCVASGGAHAVFNGKIVVREGAQQTDAGQSCRGLLLSERARIDAKPQLEIFADDVKCAHGAAIGQLDPEETFYLQSRGLSAERARNLLTYAFAAEVIERIPAASLRAGLARTVLERTQEAA